MQSLTTAAAVKPQAATRAVDLVNAGFYVFPATAKNAPCVKFKEATTNNAEDAQALFGQFPNASTAIYTGRYGTNGALLVIDIDPAKCERPDGVPDNAPPLAVAKAVAKKLVREYGLPETRAHTTPRGGLHLIYRVPHAFKQGVDVLGPGIDTRSAGGYIYFGPGYSHIGDTPALPALAPEALLDKCRKAPQDIPTTKRSTAPAIEPDTDGAVSRAVEYLTDQAPLAVEGQGGDSTTLKVACHVVDFGISEAKCLTLLLEHWNDRCSPPWLPDDLKTKVRNAYRYRQNPPGARSPLADFAKIGGGYFAKAGSWTAADIRQKIESDEFAEQAKGDPKAAADALSGWDMLDLAPADLLAQARAAIPATPRAGAVHPFEKLNREYAYVADVDAILWERPEGPKLIRIHALHNKLAPLKLDGKPLSRLWMENQARREYDGITFAPGREVPPKLFNVWRGFAYSPAPDAASVSPRARAAVDAWKRHVRENVARGNPELERWVTGWFAHLIQHPGEKPLTALVLRGGKGVGKNAVVERVAALLPSCHYLITSRRQYLAGEFTGHLQQLLLFGLDELFWSGDKTAQGVLQDLVTGTEHTVNQKGVDSFKVPNLTRVVIMSNERWVVPASFDERRYAVVDVGDGKKQNRVFFQEMKQGMEANRGEGYGLLLRYLLDFDLSRVDVNQAPQTAALLDQKHESLEPIEQWWFECLTEGRIVGGDFNDGDWPAEAETGRFRQAFSRYSRERNIRSWTPDSRAFGLMLGRCAPGAVRVRVRRGEGRFYVYKLPALNDCRESWDKFIGGATAWDSGA